MPFKIMEDSNYTYEYPDYYTESTFPEPENDIYIYYIDGITVLIVSIFGIIGTIMSMVVLLKPRIRDFFSNFLIALSIFDCSFLIMAIPFIALPAISTK